MAFLQGLMGGSQILGAGAEQELREKEMAFKGKKLDIDIAEQEFKIRQHRDKVAKDGFEQAVKTMEQLAQTAANMPTIKPGSALDQVIDTQKGIIAKYAELTQQDPTIAEVMAQNVRAGVGQAIKPMQVGMGGKVVRPNAEGGMDTVFHNPVQSAAPEEDVMVRRARGLKAIGFSDDEIKRVVGAAAPERAPTEIATKLATAREMGASPEQIFTILGINAKDQDAFGKKVAAVEARLGRPISPDELLQMAGATGKMQEFSVSGEHGTTTYRSGPAGSMPASQVGAPAGEGGKPLPQDARDTLTGAFASLQALRTITENIDKTGFVQGAKSEVGAFLGTDPGAVDFQTARDNLKVQAQSLIKGIPSNFDVQTFINTIPKLVGAQQGQKARANFSTKIAQQLIKDTIGYYKYTGFRIPPEVIEQAKTFDIDLSTTPVWDGKGTATSKSEALLKEARKGKSQDELAEPDYTQEDLEFTAKKHGITVDEVKRRIGAK